MHARRVRVVLALLVALLALGGGGLLLLQRHPEWLLATGLVSVKDSPLRRAYVAEVAALRQRGEQLRAAGKPEEEVARILHGERRALGVRYKDLTPEPLRRHIYEVNQQRYGDPLGPSLEFLVRKHTRDGVTDWRAISDGAARSNGDVDGLLRK